KTAGKDTRLMRGWGHSVGFLALAMALSRAATAAPCVGDCQGNGHQDIGSLVTLVSIALGDAPPSACPQGVPTGAAVTVALLIRAVDNVLGGCAGAQRTPTSSAPVSDTPTPTPTGSPVATGCPMGRHRAC